MRANPLHRSFGPILFAESLPSRQTLSDVFAFTGKQKMGLLLGNKSPGRRDSIAGVVFTPTRGVIHPSFPLRGRWERTPISDEQAPSPSLVTRLDSSSESHPRRGPMHEAHHEEACRGTRYLAVNTRITSEVRCDPCSKLGSGVQSGTRRQARPRQCAKLVRKLPAEAGRQVVPEPR